MVIATSGAPTARALRREGLPVEYLDVPSPWTERNTNTFNFSPSRGRTGGLELTALKGT
ncbi:MAG: hypothetical protein JO044_03640 [Mycobacteriaceae bacterium]|nr:hypothetical protein [Mycobacteriaceae bacterium]MBV9640149.1 hypothetical protein [Mycobacteriaceae bacterium]